MASIDAIPQQDHLLQEIARSLSGLRFGSIEIQVHEGRVVSIERRERIRLAPPAHGDAPHRRP